jgi:hypothetical protein
MLRITGDSEEVIIREMPVLQRVNAVVVAASLFFIALFLIASGADLSILAWSLFLFAPIAGFLFYLLNKPSITIKINRPGRTVSVRKRSLLKYDFKVYSFNEIEDSVYVNKLSSGFRTHYQIFLPLKNAAPIEISSRIRMHQAEYSEAADLMNKFIFDASKQIPFKSNASGDD